jgi:hypothetical protein
MDANNLFNDKRSGKIAVPLHEIHYDRLEEDAIKLEKWLEMDA